jgi:hypothetical protein
VTGVLTDSRPGVVVEENNPSALDNGISNIPLFIGLSEVVDEAISFDEDGTVTDSRGNGMKMTEEG